MGKHSVCGSCKKIVLLLFAIAGCFSACVQSELILCGEYFCAANQVCVANGCATPEEIAACNGLVDGADCHRPSGELGECASGVCQGDRCGDRIVDPGEICDDGNQSSGDGCSYDCRSLETCGNGYLDLNHDINTSEQCDPDRVAGLSHDGCSSNCRRETLNWTKEPLEPRPIERFGSAMAYDSVHKRMVMFGGVTLQMPMADTWARDSVTGQWTQLFPVNAPSPRFFAKLIFDELRHKMVLFGGSAGDNNFSDTWEFDVDSDQWSRVTFQAGDPQPGPLRLFEMTYDSDRHRTLLYGGKEISALDYPTTIWQFYEVQGRPVWEAAVPMVGSPIAPGRQGHGLSYDAARHRMVVFSGLVDTGTHSNSYQYINDTWEWNFATNAWSLLVPATKPSARFYVSMVFDPVRKRSVLFGNGVGVADTWTWDGVNWKDETSSGAPPSRSFNAAGFDQTQNGTVIFGGKTVDANGNVVPLSDSWLFRVPSGGATATWSESIRQHPERRAFTQFAFSNRESIALLFGGRYADGRTWSWSQFTGWQLVATVASPPRVEAALMVFDSKRNRFVLFGGTPDIQKTDFSNELWAFNLGETPSTWHKIATAVAPPPRHSMAGFYDPRRDRIVIFGGGGARGATNSRFGDTWEFDCANQTWIEIHSANMPGARAAATFTYDAAQGNGMMFGGIDKDFTAMGDTWIYDGAWTRVATTVSPKPRNFACASYDPLRRSVLLFSGAADLQIFQDVWEFNGTQWNAAQLPSGPAARRAAGCGYDVASASFMIFSGQVGGIGALDLWRLRWDLPDQPEQACVGSDATIDGDDDGLPGVLDPDCWYTSGAHCPPATTCR
jgi:cysteine-rich repeat protein